MAETMLRNAVVPLLWYEKPREAIDWLQKALGFEAHMIVAGEGDAVMHSELIFGEGAIYVVGPSRAGYPAASPLKTGGVHTQSVHLNLKGGIDEHCERARAAGAKIHREPADQPYGDRVYTCEDPEGHHWSFGQPVKVMTTAEMEAATGRKIEAGAGG